MVEPRNQLRIKQGSADCAVWDISHKELTTRFEYDQLVIICISMSFLLSTVLLVLSFLSPDYASFIVTPIAYFVTCILYSNMLSLRAFHRRTLQLLGPKVLAQAPQIGSPLYSKTSVVGVWCLTAFWVIPTTFALWPCTRSFDWNAAIMIPQLLVGTFNILFMVLIATMLMRGRQKVVSQAGNGSMSRRTTNEQRRH
ncbi:hypothetical protein Moror_6188 [Moniliophthora roreri MCA 2997]|uniref:Uncharacterized protein n=1 Tax=Moniliophthora roreri (strain MCA 2997) TaxID=1381753 RepID=V2WCD0_MONRO|nr:hypothetical protein Moror_6188 [Moniliophthora roreri MCA 2997]